MEMKNTEKISGLIITAELFLLIALSLIFFNREEGRESVAENRRLAPFPTIREEDGSVSMTLGEDLKAWFEDNLGLRDAYLTISGVLNYNLFGRAKTGKVELGSDDFLYLAEEGNLSLETSKSEEFVDKIPEYASDQQKIADKLASQGIDYVLMIGPGKPSVYPEYIRSSSHVVEETIGDALSGYLKENTDVHVSWPKQDLIGAKDNAENELIYLKTDTHWTTYGRYIAYEDLLKDLSDWGIADVKPCEVRYYKSEEPYYGDLAGMMGPVTWSGEVLKEKDFTDWEVVSPKAEVVDKGERYEAFKAMMYEKNVYNPELCAMFHNDSAEDMSVLVCGDSMVGICLLPQLAECFSDLTFVWSYSLDQEIIDFVKPDLVISEFGERELRLRMDSIREFAGE
ncbi:MAG: hypothetical protein K6G42_04765 [Lachnospiraceae bacterium]|nr:hypothetical protein [Lachnospiraceae bacterium]